MGNMDEIQHYVEKHIFIDLEKKTFPCFSFFFNLNFDMGKSIKK